MQGETVSVTVTCKNASTAASIASNAYLSIIVTEDLEFSEFEKFEKSIAEKLFSE